MSWNCKDCGRDMSDNPDDLLRIVLLCDDCLFRKLEIYGRDIPDLPCDEDEDL